LLGLGAEQIGLFADGAWKILVWAQDQVRSWWPTLRWRADLCRWLLMPKLVNLGADQGPNLTHRSLVPREQRVGLASHDIPGLGESSTYLGPELLTCDTFNPTLEFSLPALGIALLHELHLLFHGQGALGLEQFVL